MHVRRCGVGFVVGMLTAGVVSAQVAYNPRMLQFDSPDHALVRVYKVELWAATPTATQPVSVHDLWPAAVQPTGLPAPQPQFQANLSEVMPPVAVPAGSSYVIRVVPVGLEAGERSAPSQTFRLSACASFSAPAVMQMTLTIGTIPPLTLGQYAALPLIVTGPSPVHAVVIDLVGDGQPAWYFTLADAREASQYTVGPWKRKGRFELTARAVDAMGCDVSNGVRTWVTIQ